MSERTTINVSARFAKALSEAADGKSIATFCDERYLADAEKLAAVALQKRLDALQPKPKAAPKLEPAAPAVNGAPGRAPGASTTGTQPAQRQGPQTGRSDLPAT